jgi:hypothetical protein
MLHYGFRKTILTMTLGGCLLAGTFATAQTPYRNSKCTHRIRNAEVSLQKAIRRHGANSRQAEERRRQLDGIRAHCRR